MARYDKAVAIVGPTTSGKTDVAIGVAQRVSGAELINADAYYIYRDFPIATGLSDMPATGYKQRHLYEIVTAESPLMDEWEYMRAVSELIPRVLGRGNLPVIEGCSNHYIRKLAEASKTGSLVGPVVGLTWPEGIDLRSKIERRLDAMFDEGVLAEVEYGVFLGYDDTNVMRNDVVMAPLLGYLEGKTTLEEAKGRIMETFMAFALEGAEDLYTIDGIEWIEHDSKNPEQTLDRVMAMLPIVSDETSASKPF